jgi:hypothetical protein
MTHNWRNNDLVVILVNELFSNEMAVWWHEIYTESNYFRQPICVAKIIVDPFG